jgi:hypothetical protein
LPSTVACNITPDEVKTLEPNRFRTGPTFNKSRVLSAGFNVFGTDTV